MHDPFDLVSRNDRAFEIGGLVLGAVLLFLARWLLPADEKKKTGRPAVFLALAIVFGVLSSAVSDTAKIQRVFLFLYTFFLIASPVRSGVLLLLDVILARRSKKPTPRIFRDVIQALLYVAIVMLTLRTLGVEPGSILTTSALLTAVVGLALQDTLGNMVSGLALQMQRPFDVGDWVEYDGAGASTTGKVTEVNWRATTVMALDMTEVIVPNGVLAKSPIRNLSRPSRVSRRSVSVSAPYDVPPQRVHETILAAVRGANGVLEAPEPLVITKNFGDSAIEYAVLYFIDDVAHMLGIESRVRDRIFYAFQRANIEFPFPTRTLHMHEVSEETKKLSRDRELEKRDRALRCVDFLDVLEKDVHRELAAHVQVRMFAPGETIVREGERTSELYIIERGEVGVEIKRQRTGTLVPVARLGAGKFFGEMSLMTGEERKATVTAETECTLFVVDHDAFQATLAASPEILDRMTLILAERQVELEEAAASSRAAIASRRSIARSGSSRRFAASSICDCRDDAGRDDAGRDDAGRDDAGATMRGATMRARLHAALSPMRARLQAERVSDTNGRDEERRCRSRDCIVFARRVRGAARVGRFAVGLPAWKREHDGRQGDVVQAIHLRKRRKLPAERGMQAHGALHANRHARRRWRRGRGEQGSAARCDGEMRHGQEMPVHHDVLGKSRCIDKRQADKMGVLTAAAPSASASTTPSGRQEICLRVQHDRRCIHAGPNRNKRRGRGPRVRNRRLRASPSHDRVRRRLARGER